jgi:1-deoxy-D-xylulose-5-phosphate synthase
MLNFAVNEIRAYCSTVPQGERKRQLIEDRPVTVGPGCCCPSGIGITIVSLGDNAGNAFKSNRKHLKNWVYRIELINAGLQSLLIQKLIINSASKTKKVVTIEDNTIIGGFGSGVLEMLNQKGIDVKTSIFAFPDVKVIHGSRNNLFRKYKLDHESLVAEILKMCNDRVL